MLDNLKNEIQFNDIINCKVIYTNNKGYIIARSSPLISCYSKAAENINKNIPRGNSSLEISHIII